MRVEVYDDKAKEESVLRLKLVPYGRSGVKLIAVDAGGDLVPGGNLLQIGPEGISTFVAVTSAVSLPKDPDGRLLVNEGY